MKFAYRGYVGELPGTPDFRLILRTVVTVRVAGTKSAMRYDALVDTGADESLLPLRFADLLGVELDEIVGHAAGIAGKRLTVHYGDVEFQIGGDEGMIRWQATAGFVDFDCPDDEMVILGHAGCLDFFTATFDGEAAALELVPNSHLPASGDPGD